MKTRLLKKIRKRYTITIIEELASNECDFYKSAKKEYGLPFFVLEDNKDPLGMFTEHFKTFEEAKERLYRCIIANYNEKFRHKDGHYSKVWWINKETNS